MKMKIKKMKNSKTTKKKWEYKMRIICNIIVIPNKKPRFQKEFI